MPRSGELEAGSKDERETVALGDDADAVRQRHGAPRSPTAARKTTTSAPSSAAEVTRKALFVGLAALLICSSGLCIREAEDDEGNITYAATSVTLFSEMLKLSLALVITLTSDAPRQKIDARTANAQINMAEQNSTLEMQKRVMPLLQEFPQDRL